MRLLRNLIVIVLGIVVLLAAGAYLLPRHVIVERTAVIDAPPEAVFAHVNSLKAGAAWSPWLGLDPEVRLIYEGPDAGQGAMMAWDSDHPDVGRGSQMITLSREAERVETSLDFGDMGMAMGWFDLVPEGAGTRITWGLDADMGMNPIGRWMGLMMDRWVGADYERGLANLKLLAEGR